MVGFVRCFVNGGLFLKRRCGVLPFGLFRFGRVLPRVILRDNPRNGGSKISVIQSLCDFGVLCACVFGRSPAAGADHVGKIAASQANNPFIERVFQDVFICDLFRFFAGYFLFSFDFFNVGLVIALFKHDLFVGFTPQKRGRAFADELTKSRRKKPAPSKALLEAPHNRVKRDSFGNRFCGNIRSHQRKRLVLIAAA